MVVKLFTSIIVLSVFLISCSEPVYFFSPDDGADDQPFVFDSHSIDFLEQNRRTRRRDGGFVYQQPPQEEMVVVNGKVEFTQLASSNIQTVPLSSGKGVDTPAGDVAGDKQPEQHIQSSQLESVPSLQVSETPAASHEVVEKNKTQLDSQGEIMGPTALPVVTEGTNPYPAVPEFQPDLEVSTPVKKFIPRPVDFLFVIDTSQSMYRHLINFKQKFSVFLQYFSSLDWQLAVTNADHGETGFFLFNLGALAGRAMKLERDGDELDLRYLNPGIIDYNRIFLDSISKHRTGEYQVYGQDGLEDVDQCDLPPYCQSYQEQPLKSLKAALGKNTGFFRKAADLAVIVISNSKERASDPEAATQPEEVIEQFRKIHGERKRLEVYGVIIMEGDEDCLKKNFSQQFLFPEGAFSEKIAALSVMTGGEVFSICLPDYEPLAQSIFNSFVRGIK